MAAQVAWPSPGPPVCDVMVSGGADLGLRKSVWFVGDLGLNF